MKKQTTISEAPESSAGDDFHVLWTIRKSFELLNFEENGLKAITIEDIDPKNSGKLDPDGSKLLGVDIAEYYGGENFIEAEKVIVSQLKYSTRRATKDYTFSTLYEGKKSGSRDGSIIHRLSQVYKIFLDEYGRDLVLKKLTFKLVSNRNISNRNKDLIDNAQSFLRAKKTKTSTTSVYNKFPKCRTPFEKLRQATKLKPVEFTDFLRLLDFTDCGTESSFYQEIKIVKALHNVGIYNTHQKASLFQMVWKRMLPDAIKEKRNKVTEIELLHCLNMSMERLFPVPQKFESLENVVHREQVNNLIKTIHKNETGFPICLHGGAGIGKSTISKLIKENFTKESEVILFDCYGAGAYLNPSDSRHLHKEAILQIANELAKKLGSPFLITPENEPHLLIRELIRRIKTAIKILRKRNSESVLVLIIDAADNSITAAKKKKNPSSFVQDLLMESLPEGFRLIVTSRSYRMSSLNLPNDYLDIPIKPFSLEETEKHLKFSFPKSTKLEVQEFHDLTNKIPRVQKYSIDLKRKGIDEVINYLKPNGKNVEDLIKDKLIEAGKKLGVKGNKILKTFFSYLISLPRPVPTFYLKKLSGLSEHLIEDLSTDIWNGLIFENQYLSFRDEDFENFIRLKYKSTKKIRQRSADLFLEKAIEDEYASVNLGIALYDANYGKRLIDVVLDNEFNAFPTDPIIKKEVFIERTRLAMKISSHSEDTLTFFKLAFIAADAAKTDVALRDLLINNAGLVCSFGESDSIQRIQLQSREQSWAGSFHFTLAGIYSRNPKSLEVAKKHLNNAEKWERWRARQEDTSEFRNFQISNLDIAYGAEAVLRIDGSVKALKWLKNWRPKKAVYNAATLLLEIILKYSTENQINKWLIPLKLNLYEKIIILVKLDLFKNPIFDIDGLADNIILEINKGTKFEVYFLSSLISFCESYLYLFPKNERKVFKILNTIDKGKSEHFNLADNFYRDSNNEISVNLLLRIECLISIIKNEKLNIEKFYPKKFKKIEEQEDYKIRNSIENEKRNFDRFFKHALAIFQFRIETILEKNNKQKISAFNKICKEIKSDWELRHYSNYSLRFNLNFLAITLVDSLKFMPGKKSKYLNTIIDSFQNEKSNRITLRIDISRKLAKIKILKNQVPKLLSEVDTIIESSIFASNELIDFYIQLSKISRSINESTSKFYFDKAINAVSEVDVEAMEQIKCLSKLASLGIKKANPQLAHEFSRFVEHCKITLDGYDNFPINEGIEGISLLDCSTAFSILCRWNHRNIIDLKEKGIIVFESALKKDFLNPTIGSSILHLSDEYERRYLKYLKLLIQKYDELKNRKIKTDFVNQVINDIKLNCSPNNKHTIATSFLKEIEDGRFISKDTITSFKDYCSFLNKLQNKNKTEHIYDSGLEIKNQNKEKRNKEIDLEDVDIYSTSSLNIALQKITLKNVPYTINQVDRFFNQIIESCNPNKQTLHLDALTNINPDLISFYSIEKALIERFDDWKSNPLILKWKKENFSRVLDLWLPIFNGKDWINFERIKKIAKLFSISDSELSTIVIATLPEKINNLSATALYQTISFLKPRLNQKENEKLIKWVLPRWNLKIKDDVGDEEFEMKHKVSKSPNKIIAQTLRYILGHPDKRIRWRGIHSLRKIVNSGNSEILKFLLKKQNDDNCYPFQNEGYTFFWISAKLYLWICISKLAKETPEKIIKFKTEIIKELDNKKLPHALIFYFIQQTCFNLYEFDNSLFSKKEISRINGKLKSKFKPIKKNRTRTKSKTKQQKQTPLKFKFNTLDTIPYWFESLGGCFDTTSNDVAIIADKFISQEWGYIGNPRDDNHVIAKYELTDNRHGSLPTVENLKIYYEYHAMHCAAMELLQTIPIAEKEYDSWGTWDYWINSNVLSRGNSWLSDLSDPVPLDNKLWKPIKKRIDEEWKNNIDNRYYDESIGISKNGTIDNLILYGYHYKYYGEDYERVSIRSALVSIETSGALLRALQTTRNHIHYLIPLEDDDLQINQVPFQLTGWLKSIGSDNEGLDKHDPFAKTSTSNYIHFGEEVTKKVKINYSEDNRFGFYKKKIISQSQNWNNQTQYTKYRKIETEGFNFLVLTEFLLDFLKKINKGLIIECTITRNLRDESFNLEDSIHKNNSKLYLIYPDGKIKTIRGDNYQIG